MHISNDYFNGLQVILIIIIIIILHYTVGETTKHLFHLFAFLVKKNKIKMYLSIYSSSGHPRSRWVNSSSEQIWINLLLHHLLTNGSSAINGCRQNESWWKHHNNPHDSSKSIIVKLLLTNTSLRCFNIKLAKISIGAFGNCVLSE